MRDCRDSAAAPAVATDGGSGTVDGDGSVSDEAAGDGTAPTDEGTASPGDGNAPAGDGTATAGPPPVGAVASADLERELGVDEFDPVGTLVLVAIYLAILVVAWVFVYFVEFLGNDLTVVGTTLAPAAAIAGVL